METNVQNVQRLTTAALIDAQDNKTMTWDMQRCPSNCYQRLNF